MFLWAPRNNKKFRSHWSLTENIVSVVSSQASYVHSALKPPHQTLLLWWLCLSCLLNFSKSSSQLKQFLLVMQWTLCRKKNSYNWALCSFRSQFSIFFMASFLWIGYISHSLHCWWQSYWVVGYLLKSRCRWSRKRATVKKYISYFI